LDALVTHAKLNLPIYWVIVSIVHALTYYRRSQEREHKALELEARLADAKLHALRMQLHPHFLFNTLNAISTLVHKDARAADEMIANLSELLRATLDAEGQEITLREEIALLDRYLEIQQTRFGDRLRIEKDIDGAALGGLVPTLILQPLVENAIRHGIEPESGPGQISVRAERKENQLFLRVHNNGGDEPRHPKRPSGIGLANTQARLTELYGDAARFRLNSKSGEGFAVEIEIPFRSGAGKPRNQPATVST
jgi:sensor histidine kinase YesM